MDNGKLKIIGLILSFLILNFQFSICEAAEQSRGFGPTLGVASTDKIVSALTSHATQRTYAVWFYDVDSNRLFAKDTGSGSVEQLNFGVGDIRYSRWWNSTEVQWSIPAASSAWHHLTITYDTGSTANAPLIYLDGISQTVTRQTAAPTGTVTSNSDAYVIGNRGAGDRVWDGKLSQFAVWNRILTPTEIATLATTVGSYNGWAPSCYATSLVEYIKLNDQPVTSSVLSNPTVTGTAQQTGLTIDYACGVTATAVMGGRRIVP